LTEIELSNQNLPFVVKLSIGKHKVSKTLIDNGASLNLITRKTIIEMGLSMSDLTPVHDTFHGVIPGQSFNPIRCIDLEVSCGSGDNKHWEMLTFKVASFNIGYNCILAWPFQLMFTTVIHTAYATLRMPDLIGVITIKADQIDVLACKNTSLSHARSFSDKASQDQARKLRVAAPLIRHQHPSHQSAAPHERPWGPQHRRTVTQPQPLPHHSSIRRRTIRIRG
jgi:hypothetical protein